MAYSLSISSGNTKTGRMPVATSGRNTCPKTCSLRDNGCYAEWGRLRIHWDKVTSGERGVSFREFLAKVRALPYIPWRYGQAGDLPHRNGHLGQSVLDLADANDGRKGWAYTHHDPGIGDNDEYIRGANAAGFTINLSADNPSHADELLKYDCGPVVTVLEENLEDAPKKTPGGTRIVVCPEQTGRTDSCSTCGGRNGPLCADPDRSYVIGFLAHGTYKKKLSKAIRDSTKEVALND